MTNSSALAHRHLSRFTGASARRTIQSKRILHVECQRAAAQSSLTDRINLSIAEAFVNGGSLTSVEGYSTPRRNLFDFGRPWARRPASARLPRQSANSFQLMPWSRPDES